MKCTASWPTQAGNELAIEVDHPDYDVNTWRVGASLFQQADARYLLIAGAHRFANGKGESVESDMARNKKSPFQAAHEAISRPDLLTLSIHGFTRGKYSPAINASDVVLSAAAAEVPPVVTTLKNALEAEGITAGVYDGGADFRELCGKVNPQGRYSNKMYGVGRYVHVEIERAYRQKDTWLPVVSGLGLGLREYFSHQ
ncbi:MAG: hypothetical protein HYU99_01285 [Deltaproteobacteria bacterium]|nr:hypothetical protein [Deltaproteobacteria bacterium]